MRRPVLRDESGSVTLWLLGLCVALLFVGGVSLDLWRVFSERRALAGIVDAVAVAGASGVDVEHYRATGDVVLDPALAESLASANLAAQTDTRSLTGVDVSVAPEAVTVTATGQVELTLMRVLVTAGPLQIGVGATVEPAAAP